MSTEIIRSPAKSLIELLWGLAMSVGGIVLIGLGTMQIPAGVGWGMLGFGVLMTLVGLYMTFSYSSMQIDPTTRTWQEVSGFLFYSKTIRGKFEDLREIVVLVDQGKTSEYYTISLLGKDENVELIYDVIHSEQQKNEIVQQLSSAIGIPVTTKAAD